MAAPYGASSAGTGGRPHATPAVAVAPRTSGGLHVRHRGRLLDAMQGVYDSGAKVLQTPVRSGVVLVCGRLSVHLAPGECAGCCGSAPVGQTV